MPSRPTLDENAVELQKDLTDLDVTSVERLVDGSPVINLVNYLILQALQKGASDIHVEPSRTYSAVRYRIDGQLIEVLRPRRDMHPAIVSRIKVMGKMDIAEHRMPQDGRCRVAVEGKEVDLRISTLPTVLGEKVVIRVLGPAPAELQSGRPGDAAGSARRRQDAAGQAVRLAAGHRAHRQRQDDDALLGAGTDQVRASEHRHRRGPGRVPAGA